MIEFTCKLCGRKHGAVETSTPGLEPEDRARIRTAWHRAIKNHGSEELKLSLKYFGSFPIHALELPSTITTTKGPTGFYFCCSPECEDA